MSDPLILIQVLSVDLIRFYICSWQISGSWSSWAGSRDCWGGMIHRAPRGFKQKHLSETSNSVAGLAVSKLACHSTAVAPEWLNLVRYSWDCRALRDQLSLPGEAVGSTVLSGDLQRKMKMSGTNLFSFFVHVSFISFVEEEISAFSSCWLKMNFKFYFIFLFLKSSGTFAEV